MSDNSIFNDDLIQNMQMIRCQAPSNIAFIKYWGKRDIQLPCNASLSMTLAKSYSDTTLYFTEKKGDKSNLQFYFENKLNDQFNLKISKFFEKIIPYFLFLNDYDYIIKSSNTFPHSAGIASSASAMASIAYCLVIMEQKLNGNISGFTSIEKKVSFIARIGSGSACRSVFGGFTVWGQHPNVLESNNEFAVEINDVINPIFKNLRDSILIVSSQKKKVSSTLGHSLMNNHPFALRRFDQANDNLTQLYSAMIIGDFDKFINILEAEALALHGLMMTSNPGYILMEPNSIILINKIREIRENTNIPIGFTLDAGPNIHLIYPDEYYEKVKLIIENELLPYCENSQYIDDYLGFGPLQILD